MHTLLTKKSQIGSIHPKDILINKPENKEFQVIHISRDTARIEHSGALNYLRIIDINDLLCGEWLIKDKNSL